MKKLVCVIIALGMIYGVLVGASAKTLNKYPDGKQIQEAVRQFIPKDFTLEKYVPADIDHDKISEIAISMVNKSDKGNINRLIIAKWSKKLLKYTKWYSKDVAGCEGIHKIQASDLLYGGNQEIVFTYDYLPHNSTIRIIAFENGRFKNVYSKDAYMWKIEDADKDGKAELMGIFFGGVPSGQKGFLEGHWLKWNKSKFNEIKCIKYKDYEDGLPEY